MVGCTAYKSPGQGSLERGGGDNILKRKKILITHLEIRSGMDLTAKKRAILSRIPIRPHPKLLMSDGRISPKMSEKLKFTLNQIIRKPCGSINFESEKYQKHLAFYIIPS